MRNKSLLILLIIILIGGCGKLPFFGDETHESDNLDQAPVESVAVEEDDGIDPRDLIIKEMEGRVAVCGEISVLVTDIFEENKQLKSNLEFFGNIREENIRNGVTAGDSLEITNKNGKYCRYDVRMVGKETIVIRRME